MKNKLLLLLLFVFQINASHVNSQNIISVNDVYDIDIYIYMSMMVEPLLLYEESTAFKHIIITNNL